MFKRVFRSPEGCVWEGEGQTGVSSCSASGVLYSFFWLKTQNCASVSTAKHFSSYSAASTIGEQQRGLRRGSR